MSSDYKSTFEGTPPESDSPSEEASESRNEREHKQTPHREPFKNDASDLGEPADLGRRIAAGFIDACVAIGLMLVLGWLCELIGLRALASSLIFWGGASLYILLRDAPINGRPLSFGKRLAGLVAVDEKSEVAVDAVGSIQRNLFFFLPPIALCAAAVEIYMMLNAKHHRRFGDLLCHSIVVKRIADRSTERRSY